ncbi:hypothetical protein [Sphingomonas sp.]|uniref:hypothetical protein n=1 Tax=Sphingomonas sp. TaxID=28214 RepID=UPI003B00F48B
MTDAPFDASAFVGDDDELTFEDAAPPPPPPPAKPRAARKGRAKAAEAEPAARAADPLDPDMLGAAPAATVVIAEIAPASAARDDEALDALFGDVPATGSTPAALPDAMAAEPSDVPLFDAASVEPGVDALSAPETPPAGRAKGLLSGGIGRHLVAGAATLSCVASLASLGAVVTVGRTLAAVQAERAEARAEHEALAKLPATIAALDAASRRLAVASAHAAPGDGLSADEFRRGLDGFRASLAGHQPDGMGALTGMTREGLSELATRLDRIEDRLDGATPGRRASRAPYPARPS